MMTREQALQSLRQDGPDRDLLEAIGVLATDRATRVSDLMLGLDHRGIVAEQAALALYKRTGRPFPPDRRNCATTRDDWTEWLSTVGARRNRDQHNGHNVFLSAAVDQAKQGLTEGGIPIGSVLVIDGQIVGCGHNRRVQKGSAILHAEMDCLENAGRLKARDYARATLYSTLSPCDMCSGTALLYKIPRIVIGENQTFRGPEDYVRSRGVELTIVNDAECIRLMREFIAARPELWNEDIGE